MGAWGVGSFENDGGNIFLAGLLAGGFAAIAFYGMGHVLGYSTPEDMDQ